MKTNKANVLYETESPVIALTANIIGNAILSGHLDGSVCRFYFNGTSLQQVSISDKTHIIFCAINHLRSSRGEFSFTSHLRFVSRKEEDYKFRVSISISILIRWGETILVASNDRKIVIYNDEGKVTQVFDYSGDQSIQDFSVSSMSPSGQSVVFGGYNMQVHGS